MALDFEAAQAVCEALLEKTRIGILDGDLDVFKECFALPHAVETFEGRRVLETIEELEDLLHCVREHYHSLGTTDLVRHMVAAEWLSDNKLRASVECRVLNGVQLVLAPYIIFANYEKIDGMWKIRDSIYVIDDAPLYMRALSYGSIGRLSKTAAQ